MTTLIDHTDARTVEETAPTTTTDPALRLRAAMAAVRLGFTWMGTRKTLTPGQTARAAETFDAEGKFLSAAKKLLDTKHPAFRSVTAARGKVESYWRGVSLPFPEPGVRLVRRDDLDAFALRMADLRAELDDAVANLDRHFDELKSAAAGRLGSLYNPADYPDSLAGLFAVAWEFPNVEAPAYLLHLNPALYDEERARVAARFEEAVQLAEQAFLDEFGRLVAHLCERVTGGGDGGGPKVFRDSAVDNLADFFHRFRTLNVRSNDQLDALVAEAQRAVRGVSPQQLRDSGAVRQGVAARLADVRSALDGLLVDRPRRRILRAPAAAGGA